MKRFFTLLIMVCMLGAVHTQTVYFEDNFDDQDVSDWTQIDRDGDGNGWFSYSFGINGSYCVASASWLNGAILTPNNYFISPWLDLSTVTGPIALDYKVYGQDQAWANEKYKVIVAQDLTTDAMDAGDIIFEEIVGPTGANVWKEHTLDLSAYAGQYIFIAFVHYDCTDNFYLNLDDVVVYEPLSDDIGVTAVVTPNNDSNCQLSNAENVTVSIFNYGGVAQTGFDVSYSINGGAAVTETVSGTVDPASSLDYTFSMPVDFSTLGEYEIVATTSLMGDTDNSNDSHTSNIRSSDALLQVHLFADGSGGQSWSLTDNTTGEVVATHGAYAWDLEFTNDVCIYSDHCYSFDYTGAMGTGAYLEILIDGNQVAGDNLGTGVPATLNFPAVGGGCAANEAAATAFTTEPYHLLNTDVDIQVLIRNLGTAEMTSLEAQYTVNGGAPVVELFSGLSLSTGDQGILTFFNTIYGCRLNRIQCCSNGAKSK